MISDDDGNSTDAAAVRVVMSDMSASNISDLSSKTVWLELGAEGGKSVAGYF